MASHLKRHAKSLVEGKLGVTIARRPLDPPEQWTRNLAKADGYRPSVMA